MLDMLLMENYNLPLFIEPSWEHVWRGHASSEEALLSQNHSSGHCTSTRPWPSCELAYWKPLFIRGNIFLLNQWLTSSILQWINHCHLPRRNSLRTVSERQWLAGHSYSPKCPKERKQIQSQMEPHL